MIQILHPVSINVLSICLSQLPNENSSRFHQKFNPRSRKLSPTGHIPNKDPKEPQEVYFECKNNSQSKMDKLPFAKRALAIPSSQHHSPLPVQLSFPTQAKIIFAISSLENCLTLIV